jgi:hypothetical protein
MAGTGIWVDLMDKLAASVTSEWLVSLDIFRPGLFPRGHFMVPSELSCSYLLERVWVPFRQLSTAVLCYSQRVK